MRTRAVAGFNGFGLILGMVLFMPTVAGAADVASFSSDLLAQGLWSAGRKAELDGEFGLAAMNYFRAYHLYDALVQESDSEDIKHQWSEKKVQAYSDGLAAVRQYEKVRGVRVDVKQIIDHTRPSLITGARPLLKQKSPGKLLMGRALPGDLTEPPETEDQGLAGLFGERVIERETPFGGKSRTSLIVRGRKFIGWTASSTKYKKPSDLRKNSKDVKVEQQLQIQIAGDVAFQFQEALTVGVRFDDAENDQNAKQSISIKFDPKKDMQTPLGKMHPYAEFGDVALSLEGTTYAAYNKSLFGLTGSVTFDQFHVFDIFRANKFTTKFVASQTKGISAHKEFSGQNTLVVTDISDINFIPKTYYDLLAELPDAQKLVKLPLRVGSERIFRDDRNVSTNNANTILNKTVAGPQGGTFKGDFDALVAGQDYFIDYQQGIVQFKSSVQANAVLGVAFTAADGTVIGDPTPKMIKDENVTDSFRIYELKNRYFLGSTNIIRNDPDFVIQIRDLNNKSGFDADSNGIVETARGEKSYNELFGLDAGPLDGRVDEKNIDFDFGLLKFPDSTPFVFSPDGNSLSNSQIYSSNIPTQKYKIHVEYVQKTNVYLLNPGIVKNSEIITVDGTRMSRDQDYFIDYTSGFLQFLRTEVITSKSVISIDYEYFPFTSKSNQTLIGTALNMDISSNVKWAATFVSNFDDKQNGKPKVNEEPKKVDITDFLVNVNPLGMVKDGWPRMFGAPPKWLDKFAFNFSFENASSRFNYNTAGEAILADFEDAGLITQFGMSQNQWRPEVPDGFDTAGVYHRGTFTLSQINEFGHLDGQVDVDAESLRNQTSLRLDYTDAADDTYISVSFHISDVAQDISKKTFLEFWVKDANNPDVTLDIGILNEDADNDGLLDSEDNNKDNLLNSGEDGGIDLGGIVVGRGNGILDSEDRDRDGTLDVDQAFFRADLRNPAFVDTEVLATGWRRYRVFLSTVLAATTFSNQTPDLRTVKDIRLTFAPGASKTGAVYINDVSIQGVSWEDDNFADTKTFAVGIVSNRTDPTFTPPPIIAADIQKLDAKALALSYTQLAGKHVAKFLPLTDVRLSLYRKLLYWIKTADAGNVGDTILFRFGPDANNYFEKAVRISNTDWKNVEVDLSQIDDDLIQLNLDTIPPFDATKHGVHFVGAPTLDRIRFLGAGISADTHSGKIFVDEITVREVREESGRANKSSFSSVLFDNLITLNGNQEQVDNTFRPIGRINYTGVGDYVPENRKTQSYTGTLNFSRLTFLDRLLKLSIPVGFSNSQTKSFINPDLVENVRRSDLGSKTSDGRNVSFSVTRNSKWPSFDANWNRLEEDVDQKTFRSELENIDKSYSLAYGQTFDRRILWIVPIGRTFNYSTSFSRSSSVHDRHVLLGTEKNSFQKSLTDAFSANVHYTITRWFDWSFNASQSLSRQTNIETGPLRKSARSRGYSWNWPFPTFGGLSPAFNWNFNFSENYNNESELKNVSSGGGFSATLGITPEMLWRRLKFFTVSYAYNVSGSSTYQNLPDRFGLKEVFGDFYGNIFFFWKGGSLAVTSDTLALLRTSANTSRGHTFGGGVKIWKSLSTTYSTAFNRTEVQSLNSIDKSDAFSFNLNNNLDLKTATRIFQKPSSAALTYSYAFNSSEGRTTATRNISNTLSWPVGWTDRFRTGFNYAFTFGENRDRLSLNASQNQNAGLTTSYLLSNPFRMTSFTGNLLRFQNRLELTGGLTWNTGKNRLDGVAKSDNMSYGGTIGLVYDLRENFRVNGSGGYTVTSNKITPDEDRSVTSFAATAELRF